jgi:hypothetical protein
MFAIHDVADIEEALEYIINLKNGSKIFVLERGGHIKAMDPNGMPNNELAEKVARWLWQGSGELGEEVVFGDMLRPATDKEVDLYKQWRRNENG